MARKTLPSAYHHGDLRNVLLRAGSRLLEKKGLEGLSLRELAKEAGVSHAAPYRHFADKDQLLAALAEKGFHSLRDVLREVRDRRPEDPEGQFRAGGHAYVQLALAQPHTTRLMFGGVFKEAGCPPSLAEAGDQALVELVAIVRFGQERGVFRGGDPLELGVAAWSAVHGLFSLVHSGALGEAGRDKALLARLLDTVGLVLTEGLRKPGKRPRRPLRAPG